MDKSHNSNKFWQFCHFQKLFVKVKFMQIIDLTDIVFYLFKNINFAIF